MYKRDDYIRNKPDGVFSKWQGFARSMLLPKPFSETAELRRTVADYSLISRDSAPKVLIGANGKEDLRMGKDFVGSRYRVKESIQGLGVAVTIHDADDVKASLGQTESIRTRLRSYARSVLHQDLLKKLDHNVSQKKISDRSKDKKHGSAEEREVSCIEAEENNNNNNAHASILRLSRSRPQPVLERHDDVDGSDSASVCGVLQEDGTTCLTAPVIGRKRCTEHKGQRISCVPPVKKLPCEEETEEICGVILPDMVRCKSKPVSRRKRCEDHKGMRVNAFFFLLNPTERDKILKEDKSKPETRKNQEEPGQGLLCEATTKNGLSCTRSAPKGSRRCWQHKDETLDHKSSENVQPSATVTQVVCGVKLYNGSVCEKPPVKGRKRCEEHKGMRITS